MGDQNDADRPVARLPPIQIEDSRLLSGISALERDHTVLPTLDEVAGTAGMSAFHFHRRFLETMGETVGDYGRRIRLQRAAAMVTRTSASLLDTAQRSGYASQEAFTRAFARQFHMPPGTLRRTAVDMSPPPRQNDRDRAALVRPDWREEGRLFGMRFHGDYSNVPRFWRLFAQRLQAHGFDLDKARAVGILHDDPGFTPPERIRYDCCIVDDGVPNHLVRAPFWRRPLQESLYARTDIRGGYDQIAMVILSICIAWLPIARKVLSETPAYEIYHAAPWNRDDWFDLTVMVPIA